MPLCLAAPACPAAAVGSQHQRKPCARCVRSLMFPHTPQGSILSSGVQHPGGSPPPQTPASHVAHHAGYPYTHFPPHGMTHGYMDPNQHPHMAPPPIPWYHFPPPPPMPPPPKPLPPLLEGESTIGIMIWPSDNGKLVVTGIKEDKSAGQSELQVGDIVAKIDGLDVHGMDASEVATKLIGPSGSTVSIVTDKGITVNLTRDVSAEEANKKVDRRYGKRSPEARAAVSQGMRTKQSLRRDKDKRISLGDRLIVAQRLENKEITAKEAQEMLGCCKSYISQMMKPSNLNKLKQAAALGLDPKLTKAHLPKFPALEDELHKWVKDLTASSQERPPVSMAGVLEKAQETAAMKGITDFKATHIWFGSFVKRYGLDRIGMRVEDNKTSVVGAPPQDLGGESG